jgi:hypothetical protein
MPAIAVRILLAVSVAGLMVMGPAGCASEEKEVSFDDIARQMPEQYKPVLVNDWVSVYELSLNPGQSLPVSYEGGRAVLALTNCKLTVKREGSGKALQMRNRRTAHWIKKGAEAVVNSSNMQLRALIVVRKRPHLPAARPMGRSGELLKVAPRQARLLLENRHMRIMSVRLDPGEQLKRHFGRSRVVYSLTPATVAFAGVDGEAVERTFAAGNAHWHGAGEHAVQNRGGESIEFVVFEMLR